MLSETEILLSMLVVISLAQYTVSCYAVWTRHSEPKQPKVVHKVMNERVSYTYVKKNDPNDSVEIHWDPKAFEKSGQTFPEFMEQVFVDHNLPRFHHWTLKG